MELLSDCFIAIVSRPGSLDKRVASPSNTPPQGTASPSPTPPATPARRGGFTREEYERRQQLRIMDDLDKVLQQKAMRQGGSSAKKARSRPRSMTREETQLSLSPAKRTNGKLKRKNVVKTFFACTFQKSGQFSRHNYFVFPGSKLNKVYSHSSLNLAATEEPGNNSADPTKKPNR